MGSLGQVASSNLVRQNGPLTLVKKAAPDGPAPSRHRSGSVASAWQDSRSNLLEKAAEDPAPSDEQARQMSAYRRWLSRHHPGKGARFNPHFRPKYRESPGAAAILYLGLGMIVVGLVFTFVGLGDGVLRTLELQLLGPSLIAAGFAVCGVRVLICACASRCSHCDRAIAADDPVVEDAWRPPKASAALRRPPTPARVTLERDLGASSSASSFDVSEPDLLSLRSEGSGSSDYSLGEFQEIELRKAAPEQDGQEAVLPVPEERDACGKEQEQEVAKKQDVDQEAEESKPGRLEKKLSRGVILSAGALQEGQEGQEGRGSPRTPEEDSDHSWNLDPV